MHTKAAMPEDAEIVYAIKVAAYAEYVIRARGSWDEVFQRAYTKKNLPQTRLICVGAEVVGWIACAEDAAKFELIDLHILPAHQKRGLGSALLAELGARAEAAGKPVELSVLKINPSQALYERFGFKPVGETETHVLMKKEPGQSVPSMLRSGGAGKGS